MMAPFQSYRTNNLELMMYGQNAQGEWTKIDYQEYFPASRGEYAIRSRMSSFRNKKAKYKAMASKILKSENAKGMQYTTVRVQRETWPKSQYGFYTDYIAGKVTKEFMAEYTLK